MRLYLLLLTGFLCRSVLCQSSTSFHLEEAKMLYPFLNIAENQLLTFNSTSITRFFERLYDVQFNQTKQIHIYHLGDSHIQADMFSGQVRKRFNEDERFLIGSRGFLFPYKLAQTNNPYTYNVAVKGVWVGARCVKTTSFSRWGIAGITALTKDMFANFTVNPNPGELLYPINKVRVFYPTDDVYSFIPEVYPEAGNKVISEQVGDGYMEFVLAKAQSRITVGLRKTHSGQDRFLLQGISLENNYVGVVYSATGANGAEYRHYLRCEDFNRNIKALAPHLIIISLGTNDAYMVNFDKQYFEANVRYIISKIRNNLPHAAILLTTPGDNFRRYKYPNKNNEVAAQVLRQVAQETDCAVWDLYQVMGGFRSVEKWYANGLCGKDMLHFTAKGYALQGNLLYEAIMKSYSDYILQRNEKRNDRETSGY